jgi:hypothetical protein
VQTIYDRLRGRKTRREVNAPNQVLTPAEEMALAQWVRRLSATGHPVRHQFLLELAEEIRDQRLKAAGNVRRPLGQKWVQQFLKRNPTLKSQLARSIEQARIEVTKEQVLDWFSVFKRVVAARSIHRLSAGTGPGPRVLFPLIPTLTTLGTTHRPFIAKWWRITQNQCNSQPRSTNG